uniref:Uncharacterized protein n=1 Tax=Aegilops tauschii TaxID=37682 RepID=N1R3V0_AEGTA
MATQAASLTIILAAANELAEEMEAGVSGISASASSVALSTAGASGVVAFVSGVVASVSDAFASTAELRRHRICCWATSCWSSARGWSSATSRQRTQQSCLEFRQQRAWPSPAPCRRAATAVHGFLGQLPHVHA